MFLSKTFPWINTDRIRNWMQHVFVLLFLIAGQVDGTLLANLCVYGVIASCLFTSGAQPPCDRAALRALFQLWGNLSPEARQGHYCCLPHSCTFLFTSHLFHTCHKCKLYRRHKCNFALHMTKKKKKKQSWHFAGKTISSPQIAQKQLEFKLQYFPWWGQILLQTLGTKLITTITWICHLVYLIALQALQ